MIENVQNNYNNISINTSYFNKKWKENSHYTWVFVYLKHNNFVIIQ